MFNTNRNSNQYWTVKANSKLLWICIVSLALLATSFGFLYPVIFAPNPINQPIVDQQKSRASGFTMKAEANFRAATLKDKAQVSSRMYATGPMHDNEVIRMEGTFTLITPDGKQQSFGPLNNTFADDFKATLPVANVPAGSKVKIVGTIYVYHREEIKSEREMLSDGGIRLYINTGTVSFHKVPNSKPPKLEVECLELRSVHEHALELLGQNKKIVSNRILLKAGKQLIDRETLPYLGRKLGMEPYVIRQLIPKRKEPVVLVVSVQNTGP